MKTYTYRDYQLVAEKYDLTLMTSRLPESFLTPVVWKCNRCERTFKKPLRNLLRSSTACTCHKRPNTLDRERYNNLAENLGWLFDEEDSPKNIKEAVRWIDAKTGEAYYTSYYQAKRRLKARKRYQCQTKNKNT